jgi:hypothetical protein
MHISYKTEFKNPEGKKDNLEDLGVVGRILLNLLLKKKVCKDADD